MRAAAAKLEARKAEKEQESKPQKYEKPFRLPSDTDDLYNTRVDVNDYMNGDLSRDDFLKRLAGRKMTDAQLGASLMRTQDHALLNEAERIINGSVQAAPQPAAAETPARDVPRSFMKKVKVDHDVYIRDERRWETAKVPAHTALKSVREDISNLEALLKCMKG